MVWRGDGVTTSAPSSNDARAPYRGIRVRGHGSRLREAHEEHRGSRWVYDSTVTT